MKLNSDAAIKSQNLTIVYKQIPQLEIILVNQAKIHVFPHVFIASNGLD